jgi:hypothetical protein
MLLMGCTEGKKPNGKKVPWLVDLIAYVHVLKCYLAGVSCGDCLKRCPMHMYNGRIPWYAFTKYGVKNNILCKRRVMMGAFRN